MALDVLAIARLFADEHQTGMLCAIAEDGLRALFPQVARLTPRGGLTERFDGELCRDLGLSRNLGMVFVRDHFERKWRNARQEGEQLGHEPQDLRGVEGQGDEQIAGAPDQQRSEEEVAVPLKRSEAFSFELASLLQRLICWVYSMRYTRFRNGSGT